ncbi:unnamed protein product, partial [Ixodes pacificus]
DRRRLLPCRRSRWEEATRSRSLLARLESSSRGSRPRKRNSEGRNSGASRHVPLPPWGREECGGRPGGGRPVTSAGGGGGGGAVRARRSSACSRPPPPLGNEGGRH